MPGNALRKKIITAFALLLGLIVVVMQYPEGSVFPNYASTATKDYIKSLERKIDNLQKFCSQTTDRNLFNDISQEVIETKAKFSLSGKCQPLKKIAFAKTHKTGSSTLQNILFRYGAKHDLNFAMHPKSWMFSYKEPFKAHVVLEGPWKGLEFDIFAFHSIW